MEFHLFLPQMRLSPESLRTRAEAAEAAGFTGLAVMDHMFPPGAADQPMYEAMTLVTWLAAVTERLRLGQLVLCDSFRHPAVLARQAVTLDHLSGGRFELGIGSGSTPGELATFGFPAATAAQRVERLAETLALLRGFWSGEPVHHQGANFSVDGARQLPTPLGRLPIVIGGSGPKTMALVAEYADWWNVPVHQTDRLESARPAAGGARVSVQLLITLITDERQRDDVEALARRRFGGMSADGHLVGNAAELLPRLRSLGDGGVERIYTWFTDFAPPGTLSAFGREVIAAVE
jgi:alkanesulfonate monooxygenase SsuD/methylene tetrahydromethanopterin reductase-like flavin-dependent oxidoreductase (luciferase family)